jgi:hypothetical protein
LPSRRRPALWEKGDIGIRGYVQSVVVRVSGNRFEMVMFGAQRKTQRDYLCKELHEELEK